MEADFKKRPVSRLDSYKVNQQIEKFDIVSKLNKYAKVLTMFWIPYLGLIVAVVISFAFVLAKGIKETINSAWISFYVFLALCILCSIVSVFLEVLIVIYSYKDKKTKTYFYYGLANILLPLIFSWLIMSKSSNEIKALRVSIQNEFQS